MSATTVSAATVFAFDAAYQLIEDTNVTDALNAIEDGDSFFYPGFNGDRKCPYEHLGEVANLAWSAAEKCRNAGLRELADRCMKIDTRLRQVCVRGRSDVKAARTELIHLTAHAKAALSAVEGI